MKTIPAGLCQCGCGQTTRIAPQTAACKGWIKGQPLKFVAGHRAGFTVTMPDEEGPNPTGLCMCGCGGRTELAPATDRACSKINFQYPTTGRWVCDRNALRTYSEYSAHPAMLSGPWSHCTPSAVAHTSSSAAKRFLRDPVGGFAQRHASCHQRGDARSGLRQLECHPCGGDTPVPFAHGVVLHGLCPAGGPSLDPLSADSAGDGRRRTGGIRSRCNAVAPRSAPAMLRCP